MKPDVNATSLMIEPLEHRENPAGNVTAFLSGGTLIAVGDAAANQVSIQQTVAGDIFAFGLNGTTVNGRSAVFVGRGILNGVSVQGNAGNDAIELVGLLVRGGINIQGGDGNDTIRLAAVTGGIINVDAGAGNDLIRLEGVISRSTAVVTGNVGSDTLINRGITAPFFTIQGFEVKM
jgi:hypothetical protein